MSKITERAAEARALMADAVFQAVCAEILEDAVLAFKRPTAAPADLTAAHEKVRAVSIIQDALQVRLDAEAFEKKKEQHRAND